MGRGLAVRFLLQLMSERLVAWWVLAQDSMGLQVVALNRASVSPAESGS